VRILTASFALLTLGVLAGCAQSPKPRVDDYERVAHASGVDRSAITGSIGAQEPAEQAQQGGVRPALAGRVLMVGSTADLRLRPHEVVLTFDDGPHAKNTPAILDALDAFGVKATFMMVGQMAEAHPQVARDVARRGHTVGTHSLDHHKLTDLKDAAALEDIHSGQTVVGKVLAPTGIEPAPFFRFPYLAGSSFVRTQLGQENIVVLDVDVDSEDYRSESASAVMARTLARLDQRGGGIVLFHDLHARTAQLMPEFLLALIQRGYRVVQLVPAPAVPFGRPIVTAEARTD